MLEWAVKSSGLQDVFDRSLSAEEAGIYKPDPRACGLAEAFLRHTHCPG